MKLHRTTKKDDSPPSSRCQCCGGLGFVEGVRGEDRPCSRCRPEAFGDWYAGEVQKR